MISDVKVQHAGVYVCRATIPGTRNFTVAMATLTVLGEPLPISSVCEHLVSVLWSSALCWADILSQTSCAKGCRETAEIEQITELRLPSSVC